MPANPIDICLENITDYFDFESLMSELMILEGYKKIIPLGGFQDRGRDAIHIDENGKTVFCYSVREDAIVMRWSGLFGRMHPTNYRSAFKVLRVEISDVVVPGAHDVLQRML